MERGEGAQAHTPVNRPGRRVSVGRSNQLGNPSTGTRLPCGNGEPLLREHWILGVATGEQVGDEIAELCFRK